jgi:hypothetical protein
MEKMISPNGVKANMCCASCLYYNSIRFFFASHNIKRLCTKKDKAIVDGRYKCGYYVMAKFFQERGYKTIKD